MSMNDSEDDIEDHITTHHHNIQDKYANIDEHIHAEIAHVHDNIWISSLDGAYNVDIWEKIGGVCGIVNVSSIEPGLVEIINVYNANAEYTSISYTMPLHDKSFTRDINDKPPHHSSESVDIHTFFKTMDYLADMIQEYRLAQPDLSVIVHCHNGCNRSAAAICSYLVGKMDIKARDAIELVMKANKTRNMSALTNTDFRRAIRMYKKYTKYRDNPDDVKATKSYHASVDRLLLK